tara:strand:- start:1114 stop:1740 length:627 start_codon:yes stop_codon:yes gene_type:complete
MGNSDSKTTGGKVQHKLDLYLTQLRADRRCFEARAVEAERLRDHYISTSSMSLAKGQWAEARGHRLQVKLVDGSIQAVNAQLQAIYQQQMNQETMALMKQSAVALLSTNARNNSVEAAIEVVDRSAEQMSEVAEVANALSTAVADAAPSNTEVEWDAFLQNTAVTAPPPGNPTQSDSAGVPPPAYPNAPTSLPTVQNLANSNTVALLI